MAGYSGTPLVKKLGIKPKMRLLFVDPPLSFDETLGPLPDEAKLVADANSVDCIMLFADSARALKGQFAALAARLVPNGMLWVAWPKKASRVPTDLTDNVVRQIGLDAGLVDIKGCAIDDIWSGLKFVIRVRDRPKPS